MRWLLLVIGLCGTAHAQAPGETPAQPEPETKSVLGAYALTWMATAVPLTISAIGVEASSPQSNRAAMFGMLGFGALVLGPSAGHWYVGERVTTGLVLRTAAAVGLGAMVLAEPNARDPGPLIVGGILIAGVWETGLVWDLATLPRSVHRFNKRQQLQIAPMAAPHTTGLAVAGTF